MIATLSVLAACGGDETSLGDRLSDLPRGASEADTMTEQDTMDAPAAIQNPSPALSFEEAQIEPPGSSDEWTSGIVEVERPQVGTATVSEVRAARNEGFDRMVVEFAGDAVPGYRLEYIDRPVRQCGSGNPVPIAGDGWLKVRLHSARAHTDEGAPTVTDRERTPELPVMLELEMICDFEGYVEWVIGTSSPNEYRVFDLSDPARLVVDIRH